MPPHPHSSRLADLFRIQQQLDTDSGQSYEELQNRDRQIGIELAGFRDNPEKQARLWAYRAALKTKTTVNAIAQASRFISLSLVLSGVLIGIATALGLFFYTGEQPINIINALMIGVGLQIILLLVFVLAMTPGLPFLQATLSGLSAGRWAFRLASLFPALQEPLRAVQDYAGNPASRNVLKWQPAYWSQVFAVWFNLGLILCGLYLVTFSDLAFGWNTTLSVDASVVQSITDTLSRPWRNLVPGAVPDASLIESTRFYRLNSAGFDDGASTRMDQAQMAGNWWKFTLLCLTVYGLVPRLFTLVFCRVRLNRSLRQAILSLPGLHLALDRMNRPTIATTAETPEPTAELTKTPPRRAVTALSGRNANLLHWGQPAAEPEILEKWFKSTSGAEPVNFMPIAAGNGRGLLSPRELPETRGRHALAVLVKAWEPPTLEFTDWLANVREHLGPQALIAVAPYSTDSKGQIIEADTRNLETWEEFLLRNNSHHAWFLGAHA